jgi:hypothetical protein
MGRKKFVDVNFSRGSNRAQKADRPPPVFVAVADDSAAPPAAVASTKRKLRGEEKGGAKAKSSLPVGSKKKKARRAALAAPPPVTAAVKVKKAGASPGAVAVAGAATGWDQSSIDSVASMREMETAAVAAGATMVAGVDEAGRGPLAGPVVAAACHIPLGLIVPWLDRINDSKGVKEEEREVLCGSSLHVSVVLVTILHVQG